MDDMETLYKKTDTWKSTKDIEEDEDKPKPKKSFY